MNILFRCDGSVKIGMGHVVRSLALADHLRENYSCNIQFAMRKSELGINKVKETYPVLQSNEKDLQYSKWLTDCIHKTNANIIIMDMRDGLSREKLKSIKKKTGIKVATIDDLEDKRLEADIAFYPPVPQLDKVNWGGFKGELYIGWEYVILRKEFLQKYPTPNNPIPNILVSMGSTDEKNMTKFVIYTLDKIYEKFKTVIITGAGYPHLEELRSTLNSVSFKFELYQNPDNITEIMSQSDFAVISFGQTAYELGALKVPAIYLCLTPDHQESSKLFVNKGIGISMGQFEKIKKQDFVETIRMHFTGNQKLEQMVFQTKSLKIANMDKISSLILG